MAVPRQCFSLLKARSIRLRCRYSSRSYSHGFLRLALGGMTAVAPFERIWASILLLSYPLSAITEPVSMPSSKGVTSGESETQRPALCVAHHVNPGAQSTSGTPQSLVIVPSFSPAAC